MKFDDLEQYKKNIYSQNGEDGVLDVIFKRLGVKKGFFVEVGAWDGKYLSNTYQFVQQGWGGIEIETDRRKFMSLVNNMLKIPNVHPVLYKIKPDNLDVILSLYDVPKEYELLNVDIDSFDYWVWKNHNYRPKVVVIESNGRNDIDYAQPPVMNYSSMKGSSIPALKKLAEEKGYTFVCLVGNLFFIRNDLV